MINSVTTQNQFTIVVFVALAMFIVFICPMTFGPPAPQERKSSLASLLAFACTLFAVLLVRSAFSAARFTSFPDEQRPSFDRLALICTRLC
jgi:hypothetical protein